MKHVLIIERDGEVSRGFEEKLAAIGSCSFQRAWTEEQAVSAAARRPPDLIVVGAVDQGCPFSAARRICGLRDVPTLLVRPPGTSGRPLPADARLTGPYPLQAMAWAVRAAEQPARSTAMV